jgi:hypothetical protein
MRREEEEEMDRRVGRDWRKEIQDRMAMMREGKRIFSPGLSH